MGGIGDMITGAGRKDAKKQAQLAEIRAEQARKSQEAVIARQTITEQKRADELASQKASMVRAATARRAGRGALTFVAGGLKKTLGA